ncbi:hypothetical protein BJX76DRAFT_197556 [Aspergillus varians]
MPLSFSPRTSKPIRIRNSTFNSSSTIARLLNYTVFTLLSILLLCLIVLTPADAVYQCYITHRLTNIFIIIGGYFVTLLLAVLIYATRIYTNRTVIGGIPKAWIPVEKEDVGKSVRRLVVEGLRRSALVAWGARPREVKAREQAHVLALADTTSDYNDVEQEGLLRGFDYDVDPANPPWGVIEHPGWSAPESSLSAPAPITATVGDAQLVPGLCYRTVIRELPHLIEAKAVSLAPPDPVFTIPPPPNQNKHKHKHEHNHHKTHPKDEDEDEDWATEEEEEEEEGRGIPDTRIVAILRRPPTMSLRSYIQHLTELSILNPPETGAEFLSLYEHARFSGRELYEDEFRELMGVFADLLRGMHFTLNNHHHHLLDMNIDMRSMRGTNTLFGSHSESIIGPSDEEGETETDTLPSVNSTRIRTRTRTRTQSPFGHTYSHHHQYARQPESLDGTTATVESTRGRIGAPQSHLQWPRTPSPSMHSLRPVRSNGSGSASASASLSSASRSGSAGGSVIRLADARTESVSGLPYVINIGR